jgi:hypothetical protein
VFLLFAKPLWADEIFTLDLARRSADAIVAALRVDSGPPLHYLLARLVLFPFGPNPGPEDILVRALSVVASLSHVPLFFRITRRLHRADAGLFAATLFAVVPLAVDYAAEGRSYAMASLLVLFAFERALALRDEPRLSVALALAASAAAAVLTHYLAVFPIAGLAVLAHGASPAARKALVLSGGGGALLTLPWLPVALHQPAASMSWSGTEPFRGAPLDLVVNLAFGLQPDGAWQPWAAALAGIVLTALLFGARKGPLAPVAGVLGLGLTLLLVAQAVTGSVLLPERSALPFLPFVALLAAAAPLAFRAVLLTIAALSLAVRLPGLVAPTPGAALARALLPRLRSGSSVCAVALWGPELDYRSRRAGVFGRVVLFPSAVKAHPGWYREEDLPDTALRAEAAALLSGSGGPPPSLFVLPRGSRASAALRERLDPSRSKRLVSTAYFEIIERGNGR